MGQSSRAYCSACGYQVGIRVGGPRAGFREYSAWPVTCAVCRAITSANTCKLPLVCRECGSSNVIELQDSRTYTGDGERTVLQAWNRKLTDGRYKCPRCGGFELRVSEPFMFFD